MRFAVATRNSEMSDAPGDPIVTKRILLFVQLCEMIRMPHCEPWWIRCQSRLRRFAPICRGLLEPAIFTVDSPRADKWAETSSFRFVCTIAPEAPRRGAR
jgi:hypothetical protein